MDTSNNLNPRFLRCTLKKEMHDQNEGSTYLFCLLIKTNVIKVLFHWRLMTTRDDLILSQVSTLSENTWQISLSRYV